MAGLGHAEAIVMNLLDGLSGCYQTVVADNFFTSISLAKSSQVHHYDDRKRLYTAVYDDVNARKRYIYDRKRAVNDSFGWHSITAVFCRVVYGQIRTSFTVIYVP